MKIKQMLMTILVLGSGWLSVLAQEFSMAAVTGYPFPSGLTSAASGSKIAVAINEKGKRNIYTAQGPAFNLKKITDYHEDEGQEITGITISPDGNSILYVRGGDHGAFAESVPRNPAAKPFAPRVLIYHIPFDGGNPVFIDEGDHPVVHPTNNTVAYLKNDQVWIASLAGAPKPARLFFARGRTGSIKWSPDGSRMAFVSARGNHSFIGLFKDSANPIQWISPDFARDVSPIWSRDGKKIIFVRSYARGGKPDSLTSRSPSPWTLCIADAVSGSLKKIWNSPKTLRGSIPDTHGRYNLLAASGGKIVFMSAHDGWSHLYSIDSAGGSPIQLSSGKFILEHIELSPDGNFAIASANTGPDKDDLDRRHIVKVSVDKAALEVLTPGTGIESFPVITGDGTDIAYISATAQVPGLLTVMNTRDKKVRVIGKDLLPADFPVAGMVTPKSVTFKASDGQTVYGQLFEPKAGNAKRPAIVFIHGGPSRQMLLGWHYGDYYSNTYALNQYLTNLGFVVLAVNYRLGIGYGYDFQHPVKGGYFGASEYLDVRAAGEWLKTQPQVDASRIGVYGGSYGGYLTALALGRDSKLFAAGVDIHGVHNHLNLSPSQDGEQAPDAALARKLLWESSPVSWVSGMTSPILFIHGDDDGNVDFEESIDLVRRFQQLGKPYESMVIPDETHHWMRYENTVRVDEAVAEFLKRKLMKP
ncbi:MAG: S9 family peptidase [Chitinophagaceae bacterium]|nr:MAG: S9 family peptidase [Chitinophagaceae bacterium]